LPVLGPGALRPESSDRWQKVLESRKSFDIRTKRRRCEGRDSAIESPAWNRKTFDSETNFWRAKRCHKGDNFRYTLWFEARYPRGKGEVCKTFMRGFDSHPRLQQKRFSVRSFPGWCLNLRLNALQSIAPIEKDPAAFARPRGNSTDRAQSIYPSTPGIARLEEAGANVNTRTGAQNST
jgi:hypothetical protein